MTMSLFYVLTTELPYNDYFEYFGPDFKLHISPTNMSNHNTPEYLDKIKWVELKCYAKMLIFLLFGFHCTRMCIV